MQVTIDIPEPVYRELESQARAARTSLQDLLAERAVGLARGATEASSSPSQKVQLPIIRGGEPGPLLLNGTNLNDIMFMTDDEFNAL
jgi:hypothetical protein